MSPRNQTVPEGKATNISCKVKSGVPKPALSWSFKDKRLPPVIAVTEMENGSVIHVQNTTKYMEGTYKCTARNKANESTATSTLRVLGMLWVFICNDLSSIDLQLSLLPCISNCKSHSNFTEITFLKLQVKFVPCFRGW